MCVAIAAGRWPGRKWYYRILCTRDLHVEEARLEVHISPRPETSQSDKLGYMDAGALQPP